jgi:hypothetical protein
MACDFLFFKTISFYSTSECHSYIQLYGRGGSLVGDRGTVFLASQQTGPFGPNSPYIKAVSATCFGGCTQLKQAVLC